MNFSALFIQRPAGSRGTLTCRRSGWPGAPPILVTFAVCSGLSNNCRDAAGAQLAGFIGRNTAGTANSAPSWWALPEWVSSRSVDLGRVDPNRNIDAAARDVQAADQRRAAQLPPEWPSNPSYKKVNPADAPRPRLALGRLTLSQRARIYDLASSVLQQRLSQEDGVGGVDVGGGALLSACRRQPDYSVSARRSSRGAERRQRQPSKGCARRRQENLVAQQH